MTNNHIDIHAILQSPRQFCDLETFISIAELARDNESEIATLREQVAAGNVLRDIIKEIVNAPDNTITKITMVTYPTSKEIKP